jgi:hypothetical protein
MTEVFGLNGRLRRQILALQGRTPDHQALAEATSAIETAISVSEQLAARLQATEQERVKWKVLAAESAKKNVLLARQLNERKVVRS